VRKAFEGDVAGKHVKWHDVKLVDRRLVVQDDVWSVVSLLTARGATAGVMKLMGRGDRRGALGARMF
jgi:hypothetical protein